MKYPSINHLLIKMTLTLCFWSGAMHVTAQCDININVNPSTCNLTTNFYMADVTVEITDPPSDGLAIIYHEGYTHVEDLSSHNTNPLMINFSVPYLHADAQNKTIKATLTEDPNCIEDYTYQAPSQCANVAIVGIACSCVAVQPWDYEYVCDDGIDSEVIIGEGGFVGIAWYNDDGDFISTDQNLVVTSDTPGMEDGTAYFYMHGINNEGRLPLNCCRYPILVKQCPVCEPHDQVHVEDGDVFIDNACHGVIMTAPNGLCYRMKVSNEGSFISEIVACPN